MTVRNGRIFSAEGQYYEVWYCRQEKRHNPLDLQKHGTTAHRRNDHCQKPERSYVYIAII
jgi:hypothetical protein